MIAVGLAAKVAAPATARHDPALTYTITITDQGPSAAWQLRLGGHLPAGTAFRSATAGRDTMPVVYLDPGLARRRRSSSRPPAQPRRGRQVRPGPDPRLRARPRLAPPAAAVL